MGTIHTIILGVVEGLTEFLPVSSTGHLILTSSLLGIRPTDASKAFEVIIQSGAIFAVIWEYRRLLANTFSGLPRGEAKAVTLTWALIVAFIPAAVVGLMTASLIKRYLFGVIPVIGALIVGGVVMIIIERKYKVKTFEQDESAIYLSHKKALFVGFAQCFALWPGVSRAMATILGGRMIGLSPKRAAEFSFLLAIPTVIAASAYDLFKSRHAIAASHLGITQTGLGMFISFIVALIVIRAFLKFLGSHSLEAFGWYRILIGFIFLGFLWFK